MHLQLIFAFIILTNYSVFLLQCLRKPNAGKWISNGKFSSSIAIVAGQEKTDLGKHHNLYICKADGYAGKILPTRECYIYLIGTLKETLRYSEFLTEVGHTVWAPINNQNSLPCNSIATEENPRVSTYIGRTFINKFNNDNLIPGHVINRTLFVAYYGVSTHDSFEILTGVPNSLSIPAFKSTSTFETLGNYLTFKVQSEDEVSMDFGIGNEVKVRLTIGSFNIKIHGQVSILNTKQLINGSTLNGFWIRWISGNSLEIGQDGDIKPLVAFEGNIFRNFNTILFSSNGKPSYWQIADLPKY